MPSHNPFWFQTQLPYKAILQNRVIVFMSCFYLVSCWCDTMYFRSALETLLCQKGKNKICVSLPWSRVLGVVSEPHSGPGAASGQAFLEKLSRSLSHTSAEAPTKPGHTEGTRLPAFFQFRHGHNPTRPSNHRGKPPPLWSLRPALPHGITARLPLVSQHPEALTSWKFICPLPGAETR